MELKLATIVDIPLIQQLAKNSWQNTYREILSQDQINYMLDMMYSEDELTKHIEHVDNYFYYLLQYENKSVGFIGFEVDFEPKTTKLHRIYLLKEASGKNIGKKAIQFIEQQMHKYENNRLILTVNKNNSAKIFYEKMGFTVYDEAIFDIGNGYVMDDYLMEKIPYFIK